MGREESVDSDCDVDFVLPALAVGGRHSVAASWYLGLGPNVVAGHAPFLFHPEGSGADAIQKSQLL